MPQVTLDKINQWLQSGDVEHLKEFVHDGYGQHIVGKTSWNEEVRQYLKALPLYLVNKFPFILMYFTKYFLTVYMVVQLYTNTNNIFLFR